MLWICGRCTCAYSVGAPACPHCGATNHHEEGQEPMPKITVHGGPSVATEETATSETAASEDQTSPEVTETPTDTAEAAVEEEPTTPDYDALTLQQLREEASRRGLDHTGKKAELIERLQDSDKE